MLDKLKDLDLRYEDLESQLGDPRVYGDAEKLRQVNRELKELLPVVETYRAYQAADSRRREAEELYRSFGKAWAKFPETWKLYLLSSHTEFERTFGKKADKKRKLYNGMLKCDLFMYLG